MKTHKEIPNKSDEYYKLTGKEVILVFYDANEVTTLNAVNANWTHYKNIDTDMILLDNSMSIDGQSLENIHIKIVGFNNNALEVKLFGKLYPKFQDFTKEKDITKLTDCLDCFICQPDFARYVKRVIEPTPSVKSLHQKIADVAKTIVHDDEYGYAFYNKKTKQIWWVASDGLDGDDTEDSESDIINKFSQIKGIKSVVVEMEYSPTDNEDEDDGNWEEIEYK